MQVATIQILWLASLSEAGRQRVYAVMRDLGAFAESEWAKARERSPRPGEHPSGSAFFDHVLQASEVEDFLRALRDGSSPKEAASLAAEQADRNIEAHNARCPDDPIIRPGWVRATGGRRPIFDALVARVERSAAAIELDGPTADLVWSALWLKMDALQTEHDAVHYERRFRSDIESDLARLVPVLEATRAAGNVVSRATLSEMLAEYALPNSATPPEARDA